MEYLINKKVIHGSVQCENWISKCENILTYPNDVYENLILHCSHIYYKIIRERKRQRKMYNFKINILHMVF